MVFCMLDQALLQEVVVGRSLCRQACTVPVRTFTLPDRHMCRRRHGMLELLRVCPST